MVNTSRHSMPGSIGRALHSHPPSLALPPRAGRLSCCTTADGIRFARANSSTQGWASDRLINLIDEGRSRAIVPAPL
eukprot:5933219-Prymnesium_polylepis.3